MGDGKNAESEFKKVLAHPSVNVAYALSYLGIARAYALSPNIERSKKAYGDFFALWKDADPEIPILVAAKNEYAKLN